MNLLDEFCHYRPGCYTCPLWRPMGGACTARQRDDKINFLRIQEAT